MLPTLSPSGRQLAYLELLLDGKIKMGPNNDQQTNDAYVSELYVMDLVKLEQKNVAGTNGLLQPIWVDEYSLGYVELTMNSSIIWAHNLKDQTRIDISNEIKTRFWKEKLKAAQAQQSPQTPTTPAEPTPPPQPADSEIGRLYAQLEDKKIEIEKLTAELKKQEREMHHLKQRIEYQENRIASLQQQVAREKERQGSLVIQVVLAVSAALILLVFRLIF